MKVPPKDIVIKLDEEGKSGRLFYHVSGTGDISQYETDNIGKIFWALEDMRHELGIRGGTEAGKKFIKSLEHISRLAKVSDAKMPATYTAMKHTGGSPRRGSSPRE